MKTKLIVCPFLILVVLSFPVLAQTAPDSPQDTNLLLNRTPAQLIERWEDAPHAEQAAIQDRLFDNIADAAPVLRDKILAGTQKQKLLACAMVAEMQDANSVPVLIKAMDDPDDKVKTRAVSSLRKMKARQAKDKIKAQLGESENKGLIKSSLAAIGFLGDSKDISTIKPYLKSPDESVRINAAAGLALLGNYEGEQILLEGTFNKNPLVKKDATYALGFLNTPESKTRLQQIIDDPDGQWKSYARISRANQALANMKSNEKIGYLIDLSSDNNQQVAEWAVEQLAEYDTSDIKQNLKAIAESDSKAAKKANRQLKIRNAKNAK